MRKLEVLVGSKYDRWADKDTQIKNRQKYKKSGK